MSAMNPTRTILSLGLLAILACGGPAKEAEKPAAPTAPKAPEISPAAEDKFNAALDAALAKIDPTGTNRITRDEMHDIVVDIMKANGD